MPAVRGVAPGDEIRVVRGDQVERPSGSGHAVELGHRLHHVLHVLDEVDGADLIEDTFHKWQRLVQVADDIRRRGIKVRVHADGARRFHLPAANLQNAFLCGLFTHCYPLHYPEN